MKNKLTAQRAVKILSPETITLNPMDLEKATEWEDFVSLWMASKEIDMQNQWFKGDIANRVSIVHGESSLTKFAEEIKEKRVTIESYRRVARAFPKESRTCNLQWTHYFLASFTDSFNKGETKFDGDERFKWIEKANDEGWSTARLSEEIKKKNALADSNQDIFQYYSDYLDKVSNIILHIEKDKITREEADNLLTKLMGIHIKLDIYLKTIR